MRRFRSGRSAWPGPARLQSLPSCTASTSSESALANSAVVPPPAGLTDISAGVDAQTAAVEANTAALTGATPPAPVPSVPEPTTPS